MKRARNNRLAVPFVVTLSTLPACKGAGAPQRSGCEPPDCHMNPPPPPSTSAPEARPPLAVATGPKLCTETKGARPCVRREPSGSCVLVEDDGCAPGVKCNPPPPSPTPCP